MPFTIENLIDALLLLLHSDDSTSAAVVDEMLNICDKEVVSNPQYTENNLYALYVDLLRAVYTQHIKVNNRKVIEAFLLKLKTNNDIIRDPDIYNNLKRIFSDDTALGDNQRDILLHKISNAILCYKNSSLVRMLGSKMNRIKNPTTPVDIQNKLIGEINDLCNSIMENNRSAVTKLNADTEDHTVSYLDFSDKGNIERALKAYEENNVTSRFVTGWHGLNRAMGGGFSLGSSIVFNALAFSAKSLMLLNFVRWTVTLNDAPKQFKNPVCILYSLENETPQNLKLLFNAMYINKFRKEPPTDWDLTKIANFCFAEAKSRGWTLIIDRRLGTDFGYAELVASYQSYVAKGMTPLVVVIDYMNMMRKGGVNGQSDRNDLMIRELYNNVRNFLANQPCTLVTAHQLNRKAAEMARLNPYGAVKKFGPDMLSDSTDPQREVDITFYQHKEKDTSGRWWLTFNLAKDRYHHNTPEEDKFFAYMFDPKLGILDDIEGEDKSTTNINAVPVEDKEVYISSDDVLAS